MKAKKRPSRTATERRLRRIIRRLYGALDRLSAEIGKPEEEFDEHAAILAVNSARGVVHAYRRYRLKPEKETQP
jgi:hypothetical protein